MCLIKSASLHHTAEPPVQCSLLSRAPSLHLLLFMLGPRSSALPPPVPGGDSPHLCILQQQHEIQFQDSQSQSFSSHWLTATLSCSCWGPVSLTLRHPAGHDLSDSFTSQSQPFVRMMTNLVRLCRKQLRSPRSAVDAAMGLREIIEHGSHAAPAMVGSAGHAAHGSGPPSAFIELCIQVTYAVLM